MSLLEEILLSLPDGTLTPRQHIALRNADLDPNLLPEDVGAATAGVAPLAGWREPWDYRVGHPDHLQGPPTAVPEGLVLATAADAAAGPLGVDAFFDEAALFLSENYVEDVDAMFRFSYRAAHLSWGLLRGEGSAGSLDLIVALREEAAPQRIVAFAAAAPTLLWTAGATVPCSFIDFVCVHKERRGQRLCPLLYDVLLRRLAARGISRVVKTTGSPISLPIASARYFHLPLMGPRLLACAFSHSSESAVLPVAALAGLRDLEPRDATSALALLDRVAERHELSFKFSSPAHLAHVLLPRAGLVHTLVAATGGGEVTDLVSLYLVASEITGDNPLRGEDLTVAYLYFFGGTTRSAEDLYTAAAAKARELGADVFNALPISDMQAVLYDPDARARLSIGLGNGCLRYFAANVALGRGGVPSDKLFLFPGV